MKSFSTLVAILATAAPAFALLATTTRYDDGQEGACGCGSSAGAFSWQYEIDTGVYTAAGSQVLFDANDSAWCGAGCGKCYKLTNQGYSACTGCGTDAGAGESIIVMVTNLCPNNGNAQWCPVVGGTNTYGYGAHFDIMSKNTALVNGGWDNPVVEYEEVDCPIAAANDYDQCICDVTSTPKTLTTTTVKSSTSTSKTSTTSTKTSTSSTSKSSTSSTRKVSTASSSLSTKVASSSLTKITTKASSTSSTSAHPTTTSVASNNGTVPLYGQCGGNGYVGGTTCITGSCVYSNDWYSQCIITEADAAVLLKEGVQLYEQCGGVEYTGETTCALGTCEYVNDWYSQCRLD